MVQALHWERGSQWAGLYAAAGRRGRQGRQAPVEPLQHKAAGRSGGDGRGWDHEKGPYHHTHARDEGEERAQCFTARFLCMLRHLRMEVAGDSLSR